MRKFIVPGKNKRSIQKTKKTGDDENDNTDLTSRNQSGLITPLTWAQWFRRVFNIDVTVCPLCGGTMRSMIDTGDALKRDGAPAKANYRWDGLHLSEAGYRIWTDIIRSRLLKDLPKLGNTGP